MPALVTATDTAKTAYDADPTDGAKKTAYETALKAQQDGQAALDKAAKGDEIGKTDTINTIQAALDSVGSVRSSLGANANRLTT